jgi:hypothetical protein
MGGTGKRSLFIGILSLVGISENRIFITSISLSLFRAGSIFATDTELLLLWARPRIIFRFPGRNPEGEAQAFPPKKSIGGFMPMSSPPYITQPAILTGTRECAERKEGRFFDIAQGPSNEDCGKPSSPEVGAYRSAESFRRNR